MSLLYRIGTYSGHSGRIIQLMTLGDVLLSLGTDRKLMVWADGVYAAPKVSLSTVQCMHEGNAPRTNSDLSQPDALSGFAMNATSRHNHH